MGWENGSWRLQILSGAGRFVNGRERLPPVRRTDGGGYIFLMVFFAKGARGNVTEHRTLSVCLRFALCSFCGGGGVLEGRRGYSPPLQGAQPMPSHCLPDGRCQRQWHS